MYQPRHSTQNQERVTYNKEVQTMEVEVETTELAPRDDLKQQYFQDREREAAEAERVAREKALEEESLKLERELEEEIHGTLSFSVAVLDTHSQLLCRIDRGGTT